MIDATARPMTEQVPEATDLLKCSRCGNGLARVSLVVGSYVQIRCHHSVKQSDGKWRTCGWMNRVWPTR